MATMTMPESDQQRNLDHFSNPCLRIGPSFVISPTTYNRLPTHLPNGHTASSGFIEQPYCYDIDLDTPPINTLPVMTKECMEADSLTPTLLSPGDLGEYRVTVDGNIVIQPELDTSIFTGLKSRPANRSPNSDSAFEDLSDTSVTSGDGWDMEFGRCVRYSDVHMELSMTSSNHSSDSHNMAATPSIKEENHNGSIPPIDISPKSEPAQEPRSMLKRPKNGFIRFAMKFRKQVALNHPRLDNRDISRILGVRWRKLSATEKADYEEAFHKEMVERKTDHPQWRYGGSRQHEDLATWEPIPTRLRPRDKLKRRKIPKLTRPYTRRRSSVIQTNWVQCDRCDKWRQLPHGVDMRMMPQTWFCEYNWAPKNHCDADEDQEDPEEELLTRQLVNGFETQREDNSYSNSDFVSF